MLEPEVQQEITNFVIEMFTGHSSTIETPQTLSKAKATPEWPKWEAAMKTELAIFQKMETWKLVSLPVGWKPMGSRWVFSLKLDRDGNPIQFRARLVAKGYSQIPGQDFDQTFMLVMRLDSLQNLLVIAAIHNLDMSIVSEKTLLLGCRSCYIHVFVSSLFYVTAHAKLSPCGVLVLAKLWRV